MTHIDTKKLEIGREKSRERDEGCEGNLFHFEKTNVENRVEYKIGFQICEVEAYFNVKKVTFIVEIDYD